MIGIQEIGFTGVLIIITIMTNVLFWWGFWRSMKVYFMEQTVRIKSLYSSLQDIEDVLAEMNENIEERFDELENSQTEIDRSDIFEKH